MQVSANIYDHNYNNNLYMLFARTTDRNIMFNINIFFAITNPNKSTFKEIKKEARSLIIEQPSMSSTVSIVYLVLTKAFLNSFYTNHLNLLQEENQKTKIN